jgi:hypothetical protein
MIAFHQTCHGKGPTRITLPFVLHWRDRSVNPPVLRCRATCQRRQNSDAIEVRSEDDCASAECRPGEQPADGEPKSDALSASNRDRRDTAAAYNLHRPPPTVTTPGQEWGMG